MAKVSAPPELVSEHGLGQVTVKEHIRKAPQKKAPQKAPPKAPPVATGTPKPTAVDQQVAAAQLPERQSIEDAQKASADAAKAQAVTTQGYYAALANALKSIGPATQAGYQSAAADTSAFGKGFSDGLAHVQSQTQDESNNIAGIAGGQAQQAPGGAPDALYALGGYIPATGLAREGAAFGAAANQLPATAAGQGASTIAGIGRQQAIDQKGFQQKLTDLAAQVPGLRAQYQAQADAQAARAAALKQAQVNAANHEADVRRQQQISYILATGVGPDGKLTPKAEAELARALGYDPNTGKPTAATLTAQARIDQATKNYNLAVAKYNQANHNNAVKASNPDAALSAKAGYFVDASGNPLLNKDGSIHLLPGFTIKGGRIVKVGAAAKTPQLTAKQVQDYKGQALRIATNAFNGLPAVPNANGIGDKYPMQPPINWGEALRHELEAGVPLQYAIRALLSVYTQQGVRGRPWNQPAVVNPGGQQGSDPGSKPPRRK